MGARALLFGLNYAGTQCELSGCVNDVLAVAELLRGRGVECRVCTDAAGGSPADAADTTRAGMLALLKGLAAASWSEKLDRAVVHYSGHGTGVRDASGDEADGQDECLVPSDYLSAGVIADDELAAVRASFNPATRVTWIIDACHSATVLDMPYAWGGDAPACGADDPAAGRHVCLSGCLDAQTSADAFDVLGDHRAGGALTGCLLLALRATPALAADAPGLLAEVRRLLAAKGYAQTASLASTFDLRRDPAFL